ncbi:MAG: hypothetical protein AAGI52_12525 [Bacteroidota bacterium]
MRVLSLVFALVLAGCSTASDGLEEATEQETRSVRLDNRQLALDGFAGDVTVTAVPGLEEVEIVFTKRATGGTVGRAERRLRDITLREAGDDALYQFVWRTDLDGASVDAEARVPLGADVVVRLGAGEIGANGLRGPLDAETRSGAIRADHLRSPRLRLSTGSGAITAGAAFLSENAEWEIESESGGLTILIPPTASVRVDAESNAGALDLDPELPFESIRQSGGPAGVDFRASLGEGSARVRASTGAGDVELLRYKPPVPESEAAREMEPVRPDSSVRDSSDAAE